MLPKYQEVTCFNPKRLLLFSHTKVGKTTLLTALPNTLIIDTEDGSEFIPGQKFNLIKESKLTGKGQFTLLKELSAEIEKANKDKGDYVYDFIAIDTITGIEDLAAKVGTYLYKQTQIGKNFEGSDVVSELPQGAGYMWLRKAFEQINKLFQGLSRNGIIYLGHVKQSSITKIGKEFQAKDIALTGKLKLIISAECDAIGYLYRDKENPNACVVTFKTNELDLATGARPNHLKNKEFVLSESTDNGMVFHWNKIYKEK